MDGRAISAAALSQSGLGLLTTDLGHTRLAEIMKARGETRTAQPEPQRAARAGRHDAAHAMRP